MTERRVIAIGLDGFELSIAEPLIAEGKMPNLARLRETGTAYLLDHGTARETGLAWEHFSTGKDPDGYARWSAVDFDPATYMARQLPTRSAPFTEAVDHPIVAFDVPYMDLRASPTTQGMANWGAHDPGVECHANPPGLVEEIERKFGPYPGTKYIYGFVWPSAEAAEDMAAKMIASMQKRTEITSWLLRERLPDWQLAITVVAELHSVAEALWHGLDASHPLHDHPSAAPARRGIEGVYMETDRMIARLEQEHPEATLVVFSMHGMGPNTADLASMALLPEILYRRQFGRPFLHPRADWSMDCPLLGPREHWSPAIKRQMGESPPATGPLGRLSAKLGKLLRRPVGGAKVPIPWMPASHYMPYWPRMEAFALPAFYDGQVRLNLHGREANGTVPLTAYGSTLDALEEMLRGARDAATGQPVVLGIERPLADDPYALTESRCDLKITWTHTAYAIDVPGIGRVGPIPQRRTGGHTGQHGYALILNADGNLSPRNIASSFDMVPTLLDLAGIERPEGLSGESLVRAC